MFDWTREARVSIEKEQPHAYRGTYWDSFAHCRVRQLVSDCSSFNIGEVGAVDQNSANMLVHAIFKMYGAMRKEDNYMWKVVMTDVPAKLCEPHQYPYRVSKALEDIGYAVHKTAVHSWTGNLFEFRVHEVPKDFLALPDLELPSDYEKYRVVIKDEENNERYCSAIKILAERDVDDRSEDWD